MTFYPEFLKKDFFIAESLKVLDAGFGSFHTLVLCYDAASGRNRVFGCGKSKFGQLAIIEKKVVHDFVELQTPEEIVQISVGSLHSLFLGRSGRLYGCGSNQEGQLGQCEAKKTYGEITSIPIPEGVKVHSVVSGSLNAMVLATQ